MKSTASVDGHPIHPILVTFPVAFFTGTFICDLAAIICGNGSYWTIGKYLNAAGIAGGLLAAVPGAIDYFKTLPPDSSAKKRGTQHALLNISMIIVFGISLFLKRHVVIPQFSVLIPEGVGLVLLGFAGYMGGTLVFRNQIGVYNRYADKGKWNEQHLAKATGRIVVADKDELKTDQMKLVQAGEKRIVIARTELGYVAFDDRCSHKGASLAGGVMICGTVQCPWHGTQFDVKTGAVKAGPATEKIGTYSVVEEGGKVYLLL